MRLEFGFGTGTQSVEVCDDRLAGILHANEPPPGLTGEDAVRAALDAPIGAPPIEQVVRPNEKIAIVTSDITRPCPTWKILPPLLDRLYAADIKREDITLIFALGCHRRRTGPPRAARRPGPAGCGRTGQGQQTSAPCCRASQRRNAVRSFSGHRETAGC